jgi:type VI secretion system secreted protein VgrG
LSGIKTKEHEGHQYNELLFDDTPGEVRAKLSSEHGATQLNQGYLIHPRTNGAGKPRGEGFELRTDRQGAIRAAQGLLLSADPQASAAGVQMARDNALIQLEAARNTATTLTENAQHHQAEATETGPEPLTVEGEKESKPAHPAGHLDHLVEATRAWEGASNTDPDGKSASEEQPGQQSLLILNASSGIGMTTPNELVLVAEKNLDTISQRDTQQTTARRWIHNAGERISLFVHGVAGKANLKLIAAKGHVLLKAQKGDVNIVADQNVRFYANQKQFEGVAEEELLIKCGGAYIRLKGGKIDVHAPGQISIKGSNVNFVSPQSIAAEAKTLEPKICATHSLMAEEENGAVVPL